jgi:hypothetical protein
MRCKTGCMSLANPAQSSTGIRRTTRRAPGRAVGDRRSVSDANSVDTLVAIEVLIATPTVRVESAAIA